MPKSLDGAIQRLQALALSSTDVTIKAAPSYPVEDAAMLPLSIAHIGSGEFTAEDASSTRHISNIFVDVHFSLNNLKAAYTQIDLFIQEYLKRLAGDPTLNSTIDTIVFPVYYNVLAMEWDMLTTVGVRITVPVKLREDPTA